MSRHYARKAALALLFAGEALVLGANPSLLNSQLDLDGSGRLDDKELMIGLIHKRSKKNLPALRKLDPKKRTEAIAALLKAAEFEAEESTLSADLAQLKQEYHLDNEAGPYAYDRIDPSAFGLHAIITSGSTASEQEPQVTQWNAAMRRTRDDTLKALRNPGEEIKDPFAEGALFNYKRDNSSGTDTFDFTGTFGISYSLGPNPFYNDTVIPEGQTKPLGATVDNTNPLRNSELFLLSTLDRSDNNKPGGEATEKNSLEFELGLTNQYAWGQRIPPNATDPSAISRWGDNWLGLAALGFSASLKHTTDTDFKRRIWGGALSFNPVWNLPGMEQWLEIGHYRNRYERTCSLLSARYSLTADIQGGTVEEKLASDTLRSNDEFLYLGYTAKLELRPLPDFFEQRLILLASYSQYTGILHNEEPTDEFRASLRYYIPVGFGITRKVPAGGVKESPFVYEPGHLLWSLQVEYRNGQTPTTLEKEDSVLIGVGIAF